MSNVPPLPDDAVVVAHDLPNAAATAAVPTAGAPARAGGWALLVRGPVNRICLAVVGLYLLVGLVSLLPFADRLVAQKYDADESYARPTLTWARADGGRHLTPAAWFGLDFQGHSVLYRTLYAARTALLITILTSVLSLSIGTALGLTAGYLGGWVDDLITWVYSVVNTIPWLLLVIAVTYVLTQNANLDEAPAPAGRIVTFLRDLLPTDLLIVIAALGLTDWVGLCRLIRGETIKLRDSDLVAAGRAAGLSEARILFRHILPNVSHLIIVTFTLGAVGYLQVEVVLAFLGIGVTSKPSWGRMVDDAKLAVMRGVWWEATAATAAIFVICMALTLLGDALRDALDPKTRGRT